MQKKPEPGDEREKFCPIQQSYSGGKLFSIHSHEGESRCHGHGAAAVCVHELTFIIRAVDECGIACNSWWLLCLEMLHTKKITVVCF